MCVCVCVCVKTQRLYITLRDNGRGGGDGTWPSLTKGTYSYSVPHTHGGLFCFIDKVSEGVILMTLKGMKDEVKNSFSVSSGSLVCYFGSIMLLVARHRFVHHWCTVYTGGGVLGHTSCFDLMSISGRVYSETGHDLAFAIITANYQKQRRYISWKW